MNAYVPKLDFSASPTLWDFLLDRAFFTLVEGPLGSGKSTVCGAKLMMLAMQQEPDPRTNMRTTRWAVIRNTSVELKSTTIKTWLELFPEASCGPIRYSAPITHRIVIPAVGAEPGLDMEVLFIAMDKPGDVKKLKSLDLTGAWVNEAVEVPTEAVDMLTGRVGRFPKKEHVPATWAGVFCDTNADDDQSWVHKRRMNAGRDLDLDPALFDGMALDFNEHFYKQPPAMLECVPEGAGYRVIEAGIEPFTVPEKQAIPAAGRFWCMNPAAENIRYLRGGIGYYFQQMNGKDLGWIQRFVQAKTVYYVDGQPWVPEYSDETMARALTYDPNLSLIGGMDIGGGTLNPAAVIGQRGALGDYRILAELTMAGVGLDEFEAALKALIAERFGNAKVRFGIDPAAKNRDPLYAATLEHHLTAKGFTVALAPTNSPVLRRQALAGPMTRVVRAPGGVTVPGFLVDKSCTMLRAALAGKWHKKRIQGSDGRFSEEPVKNQWSHVADGASYLCSTFGEHALLTERHDAAATERGRAFQQARAGVRPMAMKVDFSSMFGGKR